MDVAVELEDDLFFADLSKQISLLIMDEDEQEDPLACCPPEPLQVFSGAIIHPPPLSVIVYEQGVRRASKGTGVFIPQSTQPRRRQRRGRSASYAKHQKPSEDTRMVSRAPNSSYSFRSRNG
ncbi:uncharacterized protein LOC114731410 [Neltuma alba]|uniref:uncharacterized protein LOC114730989 n=1 Tax=Neltuma alba TaxID=207710 RepID=UPI0010A4A34C|nr:uncharacterized protein LOC114730989 [Prosopis alba]XP_028774399.1 uncharacterized protein LOC114731410 [Prosopis alba]